MAKSYYGFCGSCRHCVLGDSYTSGYVTHFKCSRNGYRVTATEQPCNHYEPDRSRINEIIAQYDR